MLSHGYDFNRLLAEIIKRKQAEYADPDRRPKTGRRGLSAPMFHATWTALTDMDLKEQAKATGVPYDSLLAARVKKSFREQVLKNAKEFIDFAFSRIVHTALGRVRTYPTVSGALEADLDERGTEEKTVASADTLSPDLLSTTISHIGEFLKHHRQIQELKVAGSTQTQQESVPHHLARQYFEVVQETDAEDIDNNRLAREWLPLVVRELYQNCICPLIVAFREKLKTDYRRMKEAAQWAERVDEVLEASRIGLTEATAQLILNIAAHSQGNREAALSDIIEQLSSYQFLYQAEFPPRKEG